MKILHIITSLRTGGAERLLTGLLPRLKEQGHQADLLLFDGTHTPFYKELQAKGIHIISLGKGVYSMYNPLHVFRLKKYISRYDVIHTHNTPCQLLMAMAGSGASLLVTTEHNTDNRRRVWKGWRYVDRWMYGKYARIVCVSKSTEESLNNYLQDEKIRKRTVTIANGVNLLAYRQAVPNARLLERYAGKHIVVMVAAFRKQKDQKTLIRAMKLLPDDYVLLLAGEGECREDCEKEVELSGLEKKVIFLGNCTDVPSLLATARIIVMSSHYEGLSLSSIEGMASGKACIASDVPGLREVVGGAGLLFPCQDVEALSKCIRQLCENPVLYSQTANRCKLSAGQYDIFNMVSGYTRIYQAKNTNV